MSAPKNITVSRDYSPAPDACVHALVTLLKSSTHKKAPEPTPEPDGRDAERNQSDGAKTQHSR